MLSKCANPDCSAPFLYFHQGKLFRIERRAPAGARDDAGMSEKKRPLSIEYFWLCEGCAPEMTLVRGEHGDVEVSARPPSRDAAVERRTDREFDAA